MVTRPIGTRTTATGIGERADKADNYFTEFPGYRQNAHLIFFAEFALNFIAIDFETANYKRNTACAVGLAVVENGVVTQTHSRLIRPPSLDFNPNFIRLHGITPEAVRNAPTFDEVWREIDALYQPDYNLLAAHNATFDMSVLKACLAHYGMECPSLHFFCTYNWAKLSMRHLPNHRLNTLATVFDLPLDHHDATSDAIACAEIALRLHRLSSTAELRTCLRRLNRRAEKPLSFPAENLFLDFDDAFAEFEVPDFPEYSAPEVTPAPPDGRFSGLRFVFTGEMCFLRRSEATAIVESHSGTVTSSVSRKTDYLVAADEVMSIYKTSGRATGKLARAVEISDAGGKIEIVSEADFLEMIS